jgi:UDP-N-acetylglucosamine 2-epimerase (non-hydrolysing)
MKGTVVETILTIAGTRPEAIKLAPVIKEIERRSSELRSCIVVTAQHRHLLDRVLDLWRIVPNYDLDIMSPNQSLSALTSRVLGGIADVIEREQPQWVLVQGDTTSAMAGTLAAFYQGVPVGHVEAGLRTYDMYHPFPEEVNRRFISLMARLHFAPTRRAADNLVREGNECTSVYVTGNTIIDAFNTVSKMRFDVANSELCMLPAHKRLILVTAHRRENFGQGIKEICQAIRHLSRHEDVHIAMPVHPNPHITAPVHAALSDLPNVTLLPPLDYQPFVWLLRRCLFVLTDSGGLQEEATCIGKPVLVLRDTTERPEGVDAGSAVLVGAHRERIIGWAERLLKDESVLQAMTIQSAPYGDGFASRRIVDLLTEQDRVIELTRPMLDRPTYTNVVKVNEYSTS